MRVLCARSWFDSLREGRVLAIFTARRRYVHPSRRRRSSISLLGTECRSATRLPANWYPFIEESHNLYVSLVNLLLVTGESFIVDVSVSEKNALLASIVRQGSHRL